MISGLELAVHHCVLNLNPGTDHYANCFLLLYSVLRGFSLATPVYVCPQKQSLFV